MKRFLAAQFVPVLRAWRNGYEAEVRRAAIAFFLLVFLAFGVCLAVPELRLGFSAYLQHLFQGMDLTDGAGNLSPLLLLANNLRACAVTMLYGLIPFVRLPALALGVNAVLLGGLAACYAATDTTMLLYAASLLPHGIFELPALILAFSMGLYICGHLTRRCRRDPAALPLGACLGLDIRRVVETGITPLINTGIAHKEAGIGQIGAGTVRAPLACFEQALEALAESMGIG